MASHVDSMIRSTPLASSRDSIPRCIRPGEEPAVPDVLLDRARNLVANTRLPRALGSSGWQSQLTHSTTLSRTADASMPMRRRAYRQS